MSIHYTMDIIYIPSISTRSIRPPCEVTISLSTETWRLRLRRNYGLVASGAHVLHGLEGTTVGPGAAGGAILNGNQNGGWWFEEFE